MKKQFYSSFVILGLLTQMPAFADHTWKSGDAQDDPRAFDSTFKVNFQDLPLFGQMTNTKRGWADTYWPKDLGMITDRWQIEIRDPDINYDKTFKDDQSPNSLSTLQAMSGQPLHSANSIDALSPAEKFDLARAQSVDDLNYPITSAIRKSSKPTDKDWRGICNGWTVAALNVDEPHAIVYSNDKLGIKIPFGSSDLKGLLDYYYGAVNQGDTKMLGHRCDRFIFGSSGCAYNDLNAAAFHIFITNTIGLRHQGFAADSDPGPQIWNQPFVSYNIDTTKTETYTGDDMSSGTTKGTVKEVVIYNDVTYVDELYTPKVKSDGTTDPVTEENYENGIPTPHYEPVLGTPAQHYKIAHYKYSLELDANDNIIGGQWWSGDHPDFIWAQEFAIPSGDWALLNTLLATPPTDGAAIPLMGNASAASATLATP